MIKKCGIIVFVLAVITLLMGAAFLYVGFDKQNFMSNAMKQEKITLGIAPEDKTNVIDSMDEALKAGDTVREHRHKISPTYGDLLGNKNFDPTNPQQLTYAQAMNLENYLYLAVASFGLVQIALASGGFMIITALALGLIGLTLLQIAKKIV